MSSYIRCLILMLSLFLFGGCGGRVEHINYLRIIYDDTDDTFENISVYQKFYEKVPYREGKYVYHLEDMGKCDNYDNKVLIVEASNRYKINTDSAYIVLLPVGGKIPAKLVSAERLDDKIIMKYYLPVSCADLRKAIQFKIADISLNNIKLPEFSVRVMFQEDELEWLIK
ncbi:hypothetical protein RsTz2092_13340 [Deferribacterales bacterium RsTz2092]|nr:hypothetical protein AGMMS49941_13170 [Deferribacterales bacterium]